MRLLTLLLLFISIHSFAQEPLPRPKTVLEVGLALGSYRGDLSSKYSKVNGGANIGFLFKNQKRWNIRFDMTYLYLQGQKLRDSDYVPPLNPPFPNDYFESQTLNFSLSAGFNIINSKRFRLYINQGIGLFYYNPYDQNGNELIENIKDEDDGIFETRNEDETYSNFAFSLPTRVGFTYYFKNNFGFGASATFINPLTDYLDNISDYGNIEGNDNVMSINLSCFIPLTYGRLDRALETK